MQSRSLLLGLWFKFLFVWLSMFAFAGAAAAQSEDKPQWISVSIAQVHPHMIDEWEAIQTELNAAYKKAGLGPRNVSKVVRGPMYEYHASVVWKNAAELDTASERIQKAMGADGNRRFLSRVRKCVRDRRTLLVQSQPDLSIPLKEGRKPKYAVLTLRYHTPGKGLEYANWLRDHVKPLLKEAGVDGWSVYRTRYGSKLREWATVTFLDSYADLDKPGPLSKVSEDKWREVLGKAGAMITDPERVILARRPDLSSQ